MLKSLNKLLKCRAVHKTQKRHQGSEINVFINGKPITVPSYFTVLQALRAERVTIPSFCYHERLSIAGNCRMCLVEIEGMWKPQIACALPVSKEMKIRTNSETTLKAQESVLEFILADHPLDCPICDQGGECDLQDLSMRFGNDRTRFTDIHFQGKRALESKNLGPLIRTEMTRCIHCTRCIRFASQVCGMDVLGTTGRGGEMLVGTYIDKFFLSELSGNIIDLCPVGALTNKPYMFKARPWELTRTDSIDCTDATGTNIVLNHRFNRLLRILPRENDEVNQEWLSDKGRWAFDALEMQRLVTPMYRQEDKLCPIEWHYALKKVAKLIRSIFCPPKLLAVAGPYCNAETLVAAKDLLNILGSDHTYVERGLSYSETGIDIRAAYSLNVNMRDVEIADKILFIGTNPRFEAPILNARIRKAYTHNECDIYAIGPKCEYNYHVEYLKDVPSAANLMKDAKRPLILIGIDQLQTSSAVGIMAEAYKLASCLNNKKKNWTVVNVVTREASFAAALEAGWKPGALDALKCCSPKLVISLGADEVFYKWEPPEDCTVIYIGFQGNKGAEVASLILPGSAYTEAGGTYLNMECRSQYAYPAITPPGKARFDWKIIKAIAEYANICLFYGDTDSICVRMNQISPNFVNLGTYQEKLFSDHIPEMMKKLDPGVKSQMNIQMKKLKDYYCSDILTSNSPLMVKGQKAVDKLESSAYAVI
ncbi:NADH-ubiquinone oxidoreductase 75 kDa subunit, mitochondrial-like [Maniola hyperantus]|uniref:NADH-ubiquinone oxidoreductase 75 kDa subunit, mitochondrial-like n=1 Tax=Aphantopus hyperantus TaxID=2795564 RepID=UPI001568C8D3|nr:NADH-ubiquinone oxidoreductase 75 kDa subunit, mitochondrial-like [Maniola hyperantus]